MIAKSFLIRPWTVLLLGFAIAAQLAWAGPALVFSRPLPVLGVNATDSSRSNFAFYYDTVPTWYTGDDFTLPANAWGQWKITSIVTWSVPNFDPAAIPKLYLGDEYSNITLWGGPSAATGGLINPPLATGSINLGTDTNTNPSITHQRVSYDTATYYDCGAGCGSSQVYQHTFSGLSWIVPAETLYHFAVFGDPLNALEDTSNFGKWMNHFTTAANAGNTQDGADTFHLIWDALDTNYYDFPPYPMQAYNADMNVQIYAEAVPEPSTLFLIGLGFALLALRLRRNPEHKP